MLVLKEDTAFGHVFAPMPDTQTLASESGWSNVPLKRVQGALLGVVPSPPCVVAG